MLQKTSQVKGRFVFVWGKNKNKTVSEQIYVLQRHKRLPRPNSCFFWLLKNSKWYEVFPIQNALAMAGKQYIMHGQKCSEVSKCLCGGTTHQSPENHISEAVQRLGCNRARSLVLDASCLWSLQIGRGCQAWTKRQSWSTKASEASCKQRPELWEFGEISVFFSLNIWIGKQSYQLLWQRKMARGKRKQMKKIATKAGLQSFLMEII